MSPEVTKSITDIITHAEWPAATSFLVFLFRKEVRRLVDRLTSFHLKAPIGELAINPPATAPEPQPDKLLEQKTVSEQKIFPDEKIALDKPAQAEDSESSTIDNPQTPEEWRHNLFTQIFSRKFEEAEHSFASLQLAESDETQKAKDEVTYYGLRSVTGDTQALKSLEEIASKTEHKSRVFYWLGTNFESGGDHEKAAEYFEIAARENKDQEDRVGDIILASKSLFNAGKRREAFGRLTIEIGQTSEHSLLAKLYQGLSEIYGLDNNTLFEVLALEKAITYKPNDAAIHFTLGHNLGKIHYGALSILHYKTCLNFNSKETSAMNNAGVELETLGLPFNAVKYYKQASEENETLATANLAHRLINAGFAKEAFTLLEQAKQNPNMSPNVGEAIFTLAERERLENQKLKNLMDSAQEQQRFFISFAEAIFIADMNSPDFNGRWLFEDGNEITIEADTKIRGDWKDGSKKRFFEGEVSNRGSVTNFFTQSLTLSGDERFSQDNSGFIYISGDEKAIFILEKTDEKFILKRLSRVTGV